MNLNLHFPTLIAIGLLTGCATCKPGPGIAHQEALDMERFYLPNAEASRVVSVTNACIGTALQDASRLRGRFERAPAFGLRQPSGASRGPNE